MKRGGGVVEGPDFLVINELYQRLTKNYDDRKDYWTAGDFHYGKMEMKRLAMPSRRRVPPGVKQKMFGAAFFGHSLMTTLSVAGFQKELKYEPSSSSPLHWPRSSSLPSVGSSAASAVKRVAGRFRRPSIRRVANFVRLSGGAASFVIFARC